MQMEQVQAGECDSTSYVSSSIPSENLIYYYTHFQLFSQRAHSLAYSKYNQFLSKVARHLGEDWRYEANKLFEVQKEGGKSGNETLFETALSIWLEINRMKKHKSIDQNEENINYDMEYFSLFSNRLYQRLIEDWKEIEEKKDGLKQLAMGFFVTASSTWEEMVEENKSKSKGLFQTLTEKIQKQVFFSPLMLAKEKIFTFFNKRPKLDESKLANFNPKNFTKFKENLEEEELQYQMSNLNVEQKQMEQESTEGTKRRPKSEKRVVFQRIPEENPINQNILKRAYSYILNSYEEQKMRWQVGKNFVTNIFEINYDKLVNRIKGETPENRNINVRVMKPAEDFYHTLMEVWLLFRTQSIVKFQDYLSKVKATMGTTWSDKYINPTKLFFSRLYNEWTSMMQGKEVVLGQDEQIIDIFVERVKEQMKKNWDREITEKTNDLSEEEGESANEYR